MRDASITGIETPIDVPGLGQLSDQCADRIGGQLQFLGGLGHRNPGTTAEEMHQLELGSRKARKKFRTSRPAAYLTANRRHGREQAFGD
jgi:hypothetical protein